MTNSMTPERKEELKAAVEEFGQLGGPAALELLAALEEAQHRIGDLETGLRVSERTGMKWYDELAEAQQTIARQQEALKSSRNHMEDALSVGSECYKDFDITVCPWADLTEGIEVIDAALDKEGETQP